MSIPLQITFKDLDSSEALEALIREKAERLSRFKSNIVYCNVTLETTVRHMHKGRVYSVHIEIGLPGATIVVSRDHSQNRAHEDPYLAVRDAFDAAARQLEDKARKMNGQVKQHSGGHP